ncbi:MAG TPA: hypothetical protein VKB19_18340 [Pedobacter sp.]|nr:hypothetical protein [Pedobacter sp.]
MLKKVQKSWNTFLWVTGLMLFSFLILVLASRHLATKFKPVARTQISELVLETTDSLYRMEFSEMNMNLLTGRASLENVRIIPDTNVYKKLIGTRKAPNNIYFITLKMLEIKNFHPWRLLRHKKLKVDVVLFDKPDIIMVNRQFDFNESKRQSSEKTPYHYISRYLRELRVGKIDLRNISFKYISNNGPVPEVDSVRNLNVTLKDWLIDSASADDNSRLYLLKDIQIKLNDYAFATPDSLYHIKLNQLDFTGSKGKLNIKSFSVVPRYSEMQFGRVAGFAKDRFNIEMSDVSLEGINLPLYIRKQELYAKEMNIANGFVAVFNNNALPKREVVKIGKYPHQLLQKLKGQLTVKQLNVNNVDISYAEYDEQSGQKGEITFEKTSGMITNITNAGEVKAKYPFMFARLNTFMMGKGKLDVSFKFDLLAANGAFSYKGALGPMDGRVLNRITRPLGMVEVRSGKVKKLNFSVSANDHVANGDMQFAFNELSVSLLKKEQGEERLVKKGFMSFLANAMVINPDNPNKEGVLINAPIHYERIRTASFFNFVWRTLFQGIKYSVGVTAEKEQRIKAQILKFEKIKSDRNKRRTERQRRRARQIENR